MPVKSFAFPKNRRLTRSTDFETVRQNGRVERGRFILLSVFETRDASAFRAGFITSRAVGSAAKRNRVRRQMREIVRQHQHQITRGIWIVTIARSAAADASYEQLEAEWLRLAKRASILAA
jgi:ribonuclease P protein component